MLRFDGKTISGQYGVQTDGVTLSGNGTSAQPIGVIKPPCHRYETCLFSSTGSAKTGTLAAPFSAFDQILFLNGWGNYDQASFGFNWVTARSASTTELLNWYSFANNTSRYQVLTVVTSNATSFNTVSAWYMSQAGTNAWTQNNGNVTRYNIIREIWGVKYV